MSRNIIFTKGNLQSIADKIRELLCHSLIDRYMPVGYVWATSKAPNDGGNPNLLYPGTTWVRIKDAYLCAAGVNDVVDSDPEHDTPHGSNTRSAANLPEHQHVIKSSTTTGDKKLANGTVSGILYKGNSAITNANSYYTLTATGGSWYGVSYSSNNNKAWFRSNISIPAHRHSIPVETADNTSISTMDIQSKHLYKYIWERTA